MSDLIKIDTPRLLAEWGIVRPTGVSISIRPKTNGRILIQVRSKTHTKNPTVATLEEARQLIPQLLDALGEIAPTYLGQLLDLHRRHRAAEAAAKPGLYADSTLRKDGAYFRRFAPWHDLPLVSCTRQKLREIEKLIAETAPAQAPLVLGALRRAANWAEEEKNWSMPPGLTSFRCGTYLIAQPFVPLTDDQIDEILLSVEGTDIEIHAALALYAGLRRGEVIALRWRDIIVQGNRAFLMVQQQAKISAETFQPIVGQLKTTCSRRMIPISEKLAKALDKQRTFLAEHGLENSVYVGPPLEAANKPGHRGYHDPREFDRKRQTLFGGVKFHMLRHMFATLCFRNLVPAPVVQKWMGHSKIEITINTYTHVMPGDFSSMIDF